MKIKKPLITRIVGNGFKPFPTLIAIVFIFTGTGYSAIGPSQLRPVLQFSGTGREVIKGAPPELTDGDAGLLQGQPDNNNGSRLAEYISKVRGNKIVNVDVSLPEQIIELLKKGNVVAVIFKNLRSKPNKYKSVRIALYGIGVTMEEGLRHSPPPGNLSNMSTEILKNAFVHGNKLNFEHPIYLYLRKKGNLDILEVFDVASAEKTDAKEMLKAEEEELHGAGVGERNWLSSEPYKRQVIKDVSGNTIGTMASLVLNPQGWDNPLAGEPDIITIGLPIAQGTQLKSTSNLNIKASRSCL